MANLDQADIYIYKIQEARPSKKHILVKLNLSFTQTIHLKIKIFTNNLYTYKSGIIMKICTETKKHKVFKDDFIY